MYLKHYEFFEPPFSMTPNSRFFFESPKHREAVSTMIYAIEQRKGFVVITGDIGCGKTTVCRTVLNQLSRTTHTALITHTSLSTKDLLSQIMDDLGIAYKPGSKGRLLSQFNEYLIDQLRLDHNVVLIIDEAQNLSMALLEEVRMLSNLETENEKLLQIIFLGQPQLKKKLAHPQLEQLRQRIAVYYHLKPLDREETFAYIRHRLKTASETNRSYFTLDALEKVYRFSRGVPRVINQLCDSALLSGFIYGVTVIDEKIMDEIIRESPMFQIQGTGLPADDRRDVKKDKPGDWTNEVLAQEWFKDPYV